MLPFLFLGLAASYSLLLLLATYRWLRVPKVNPGYRTGLQPFVSIVVVVRNEEKHIAALLNDLQKQDYPQDRFEILVVDDHSEDITAKIIKTIQENSPLSLRLLQMKEREGKKWGLKQGVREAKGEVVLVTDGDCRVGREWVASHVSLFQEGAVFVSGPVSFCAVESLFAKMQLLEFASLVGVGGVLLEAGQPGMCNAANMGFRKQAYEDVEPLRHDFDLPSGDDEFLLQALAKRFPNRLRFLKKQEALVETFPQSSWSLFLHQRKRWAGKWRQHKGFSIALTALLVFIFHASWLLLLLMLGLQNSWIYFFAGLFVKFLAESLFLFVVLHSFGKQMEWFSVLLLQLLHPLYVLFFGIAVNFGGFRWKGRTYNYAKK